MTRNYLVAFFACLAALLLPGEAGAHGDCIMGYLFVVCGI